MNLIRRMFLLLIILTAILTFISNAYSQVEKKTITLPSGEAVCDLSGEWNALHSHYGEMQWVADVKCIYKITLQANMFVGTLLTATPYMPAGSEKIRGELDKDGIKNVKCNRADIGWKDAKGEISKDCNKIVIDDRWGVKIILERK